MFGLIELEQMNSESNRTTIRVSGLSTPLEMLHERSVNQRIIAIQRFFARGRINDRIRPLASY